MKNLITKTLFVSLLFSAVAPAIGANGPAGMYSVEAPASVGFFSRLKARASGLGSTLATKASGLKNGTANLMAKYPKTTTGLCYSACAVGITAAGLGAYMAFNSEKAKNTLNKAKKALKKNSKYVRRYGVSATLLAAVASYVGLVHKGYALSPSDLLFTFSS